MTNLRLSTLGKTWLIDIDGVLVRHKGRHGSHGSEPQGDHPREDAGAQRVAGEAILPGVRDFFDRLGVDDRVVLLTARPEAERAATLASLAVLGLRWDAAIFDLPHGERVCINDRKPSGLATAHAVNIGRDEGLGRCAVVIDPAL